MCRGDSRYRSRNTRSSAKAAPASRRAAATASGSAAAARTIRMPRPPPPPAALISAGKPIVAAVRASSSGVGAVERLPRQHRHAGALDETLGLELVTHRGDARRRRTDPDEAGVDDGAGERGVLGEETVSRVHGVGVNPPSGGEEPVDVQIGLGRRASVERHRHVGLAHVRRRAVGIGVHGGRRDPHPAARPEDAPRDLAPIGDQKPSNARQVSRSSQPGPQHSQADQEGPDARRRPRVAREAYSCGASRRRRRGERIRRSGRA